MAGLLGSIKCFVPHSFALRWLFPALVAVAVLSPPILLSLVLVYTLTIVLEIVAGISPTEAQEAFPGYRMGISPRSPPAR